MTSSRFELPGPTFFKRLLCCDGGQASVEAAALLPTLLFVVGMLVQPVCVGYTRTVMRSAAAEGVRLLTTNPSQDDCRTYVVRRLRAVPSSPLFHVGGEESWEVEAVAPSDGGDATVSIEGRVRPLPITGAFVRLMGSDENGEVFLRVSASANLRPSWLEGSYGDWVGSWG